MTDTELEKQIQEEETGTQKESEAIVQEVPDQVTKPGLSDEVVREMMDLLRSQNKTIVQLRKEIETAKSELKDVKDDIESGKPISFKAEVRGYYDFSDPEGMILTDDQMKEKTRVRKIYDKINSEFITF